MINDSGSRRSLVRRPRFMIVTILAVALAVFVGWLTLGGGVWRAGVDVIDAELRSADTLMLAVASCHGEPEVAFLRETDEHVEIAVVSSTTPLFGGDDCQDLIEVQLTEPLGTRKLFDRHSQQVVNVDRFETHLRSVLVHSYMDALASSGHVGLFRFKSSSKGKAYVVEAKNDTSGVVKGYVTWMSSSSYGGSLAQMAVMTARFRRS